MQEGQRDGVRIQLGGKYTPLYEKGIKKTLNKSMETTQQTDKQTDRQLDKEHIDKQEDIHKITLSLFRCKK